jgi:ABC-type spermidine/putrescine transport system permease subunit II
MRSGRSRPVAVPTGSMDHRFALVCGLEALHLYPILYLNTATSLARLDQSLIEAAAGLGAGPGCGCGAWCCR